LLEAKENYLLDLELDVYHYRDANEVLEKKLKAADLQMVESMKKIQELSAKVEGLEKISDEAAGLIDLVDPVGEDVVEKPSFLQRLQEAPLKFSSYVTETTKSYVLTALGLLKS